LVELDVAESLCAAPLRGQLESLSVKIDPDDHTLRTDQRSGKEADVTNTATDIKYAHAAADSGREQHPLGQWSNQVGLFDQTVVLGARTAKRVVGIIHRA
jgi:hypothetical protein